MKPGHLLADRLTSLELQMLKALTREKSINKIALGQGISQSTAKLHCTMNDKTPNRGCRS